MLTEQDFKEYAKKAKLLKQQGKSFQEIKQMILNAGHNQESVNKIMNMAFPKQEVMQKQEKPTRTNSTKTSIIHMLLFLTLIYYIIWLFKAKKRFKRKNIEIITYWFFLIPVIGALMVFHSFAKGYAKLENARMTKWPMFLILAVPSVNIVGFFLIDKDLGV